MSLQSRLSGIPDNEVNYINMYVGNKGDNLFHLNPTSNTIQSNGVPFLDLNANLEGSSVYKGKITEDEKKIESKTNDPRCERGKAFFRACYIPCIKSAKGAMGQVTNHCNVECKPELWVTNYLCRDPK
jgi:hypothetical protein